MRRLFLILALLFLTVGLFGAGTAGAAGVDVVVTHHASSPCDSGSDHPDHGKDHCLVACPCFFGLCGGAPVVLSEVQPPSAETQLLRPLVGGIPVQHGQAPPLPPPRA